MGELAVGQGLGHEHVLAALDLRQDRLAHHRVAVRRQDEGDVGVVRGQAGQGAPDAAHRVALVLAPVGRHQDDATAGRLQLGQTLVLERHLVADGLQQRVDHGVARDVDVLRGHGLTQQVVPAHGGRGQVQRRDLAGDLAVGLLRERGEDVEAAQARLGVDHGDAAVEGGDGARRRGRGVALDHDGVRPLLLQDGVEPVQGAGEHAVEGLPGLDDVQVVVRDDAEQLVDLVQHLAVLPRDGHHALEPLVGLQRLDDGGHLDRLRAGSVDGHDLGHSCSS